MEFYQMPMFNKILVSDIEKAEKWYFHNLKFKSVFKFRDENNKVLMNHLRLEKYQDIMLIQSNNHSVGNSIYINLLVNDIHSLEHDISEKYVVEPLSLKPWNATEMTIKDIDGHLITLTQSNIDNKDFNQLMKQSQKSI